LSFSETFPSHSRESCGICLGPSSDQSTARRE
jgi:hypothetical protein